MSASSQITNSLRSWGSPSGTLHDHLTTMFNNMPGPKDGLNGLAHFQKISEYFKRVKFNKEQQLTQTQIREKEVKKVQYPYWLVQEEQILAELSKRKGKTSQKNIQNFQAQSDALFEPAGICFGPENNHKINNTLKILAERQNAVSVRFWGKIITSKNDYYIIQGISNKKKQPLVENDMQRYKEGANLYSFWVSHSIISDNWYQLPLVTPDQIRTSRLIKHIFTGDLNAAIRSYPVFNGEERHLLKCQLVRITHNCEIVPNSLYTKQQQNQQQIQFSQQFKMPQFGDLSNLQNWVHLNPYILSLGRNDYYKDPKLSEQAREELLGKLSQTDPRVQRLKQINQDKINQKIGLQTAWISKQVGNLQVFNGKQQGTSNIYAVVVLKNPQWPGWQTVANSKQFGSIYIGYGYKQTQDCFYPSSPEDIAVEGVEVDEFDEPNPRDPPDELEPDSDDEGKKEEES